MELWIRSQDKKILRKINALYIGETNDKKISIIDDDYNAIAFYNSKERALEVLDEIQEAQLGNFHYRCPSNVKVSSKEDTIVYEMPEK